MISANLKKYIISIIGKSCLSLIYGLDMQSVNGSVPELVSFISEAEEAGIFHCAVKPQTENCNSRTVLLP